MVRKRASKNASLSVCPSAAAVQNYTWEDDADVVLFSDLGDVSAFTADQKFVEFRVRFQLLAMSAK